MALKPCLDCGVLGPASRCDTHRKAKENQRNRPSAHARGYDTDHQHQREALALTLPAYCWAGCGKWLEPDGDWVAAHILDGVKDSPRVATCRSCNERMKRR